MFGSYTESRIFVPAIKRNTKTNYYENYQITH